MPKLNAQITTQAIIKDRKNRILLLKRNKPGGLFTLPGGTIHKNEEIKAGLKRELKEETGLDLTIENPVWIWQSDHIGIDLVGIVFSTKEILKGNEKIILSKEHCDYGWFSQEELFMSNQVDPFIKRDELKKIWRQN
jgi:8-oxo-dGTP diphosphatase